MITETEDGVLYEPDSEIEVDWIRALELLDKAASGDKKADKEIQRMRDSKLSPMEGVS